ncbi:MAG: hypothetical protein AB9835_00315 [Eubacteriales bacterium]
MSEKTTGELLREQLFMEAKNGFTQLSEEQINTAYAFCEDYKTFLDDGKTEREIVTNVTKQAMEAGFVKFENGKNYAAGDKVFINNRGKSITLAVIGKQTVDNGTLIAAAHIDSPRIDLKQRPLYEDSSLAFFKTHYYGGIKKYQWITIPLALHGVVVKTGGEVVEVSIGERDDEPVFCITDLLPHLGKDQYGKSLGEALHRRGTEYPYR